MTITNVRAFLVSVSMLLAAPGLAQVDTSDPGAVDATRSTLAKWVETKQIISEEKRDWELGREVLEQRNSLLEGEVASMSGKITEAQTGIEQADGRQRELNGENERLREGTASLLAVVGDLEARTGALLRTLPEPLTRRVEPLARKIPKDPEQSKLSLGERFQNLLGILNEVNKFNGEIHVTREIRKLPDGSSAEVETLYLGLGQAYYVTPDRDTAGVGRPGPDGWTWSRADDLADKIAQAIAILANEDVPAYVPLPVQVQ